MKKVMTTQETTKENKTYVRPTIGDPEEATQPEDINP